MRFKIGGLDAHPTKGYRGFARPRKTNKRRKLIPTGECLCPLSRANALVELKWEPKRANRSRTRARRHARVLRDARPA